MKKKMHISFYDIFMFPLEQGVLRRLRRALIPQAKGDVWEIGAGTGVNLALYDRTKCDSITVADKVTRRELIRWAETQNVTLTKADVMQLPFASGSFDTVVETLLLCSVEAIPAALEEIHRVLKPQGRFIHIDHGLPETKRLQRVFHALAPAWYGMTRSCRIDKTYTDSLEAAGFTAEQTGRAGKGVFSWGIYQASKV